MIKASARLAVLMLPLALCLLPAVAMAQDDGNVYISTESGGTVVAVDRETGAHYALNGPPISNFRPSDMVVGPDGLLYVADPGGNEIWRTDGGTWELIFATNFSYPGLPQNESPSAPEGLVFGPDGATGQVRDHDSLYFATKGGTADHHTGIWRIGGIAKLGLLGLNGANLADYAPDPILPSELTGSHDTQGMAWAIDGALLIVDQANRQILIARESPGWEVEQRIDVNGEPRGVAVSTYGDIFIGLQDRGDILRYALKACDASSTACGLEYEYRDQITLGQNLGVNFLDIDASNVLWAAVAETKGRGDGALRKIQLLYTDDGFDWQYGGADEDTTLFPYEVTRTPVVGVALPTTAITTDAFQLGGLDGWQFGNTRVEVNVLSGGTCEGATLTVSEYEPGIVNGWINKEGSGVYPAAQCVRYAGKGGRCVVYDFYVPDACRQAGNVDTYEIKVRFFSDTIEFPGFLHAKTETPFDFNEDILIAYDPDAEPGEFAGDPGMRSGSSGGWSRFVAVDHVVYQNHAPTATLSVQSGVLDANTSLGNLGAAYGPMTLQVDAWDPDIEINADYDALDVVWSGATLYDADGNVLYPNDVTPTIDGSHLSVVVAGAYLLLGENQGVNVTVSDQWIEAPISLSATISVVDTTAPEFGTVFVPEGTYHATDAQGADVTVPIPTASDATGATVSYTTDNAVDLTENAEGTEITGHFPIGSTEITWTATDGAGNTDTRTTVIDVADLDPPTITAPADLTVELGTDPGEVSLGTPDVQDNVSTLENIDVSSSGAADYGNVGTYTIEWTATDEAGNTSEPATQLVTVSDTKAPTITAPADTTVELGAVPYDLGSATCSDLSGPCTATTGAFAPESAGTYTVVWTATDAHGNTASAEQTVNVVDTTAPVVTGLLANGNNPLVINRVNHKFFAVTVTVNATDLSGVTFTVDKVTANEPIGDGSGDGSTGNDWYIDPDTGVLYLRAERQGSTNDRKYYIWLTVTDGEGNSVQITNATAQTLEVWITSKK